MLAKVAVIAPRDHLPASARCLSHSASVRSLQPQQPGEILKGSGNSPRRRMRQIVAKLTPSRPASSLGRMIRSTSIVAW